MVETDVIYEGKLVRRYAEEAKRCWKYGAAARNMFLRSISMLSRSFIGCMEITRPIASRHQGEGRWCIRAMMMPADVCLVHLAHRHYAHPHQGSEVHRKEIQGGGR